MGEIINKEVRNSIVERKPNIILDPKHPQANHQQIQFFVTVCKALVDTSPEALRYFWYGGAIRGGKTFICLFILIYCALRYPGSRWHVIRKNFPDLERTAIPSLQKLLHNSKYVRRWRKKSSDYFVEFKNGSRIYMFAENFSRDPDLDRFKGMETNGVLLEQIEEIQEKTYQKSLERLGSWYAEVQPPPIILSSFNPTAAWIKKEIYEKHVAGTLKAPHYFLQASPKDNKFVTDAQWQAWEQLDDEFYQKYIGGSWEVKVTGNWLTQFDQNRHVKPCQIQEHLEVILSFDFNVDPMTCTLFHTDGETFFHIFKEYKMDNSDIHELCEKIREDFGDETELFEVTGDAAGRARNAGVKGHLNQYRQISEILGIPYSARQIKVPKRNPELPESRVFCNSILKSQRFDFRVDPSCENIIKDLQYTEKDFDQNGRVVIKKKGINSFTGVDNKEMSHFLDNVRYGLHTYCKNFISIPRS